MPELCQDTLNLFFEGIVTIPYSPGACLLLGLAIGDSYGAPFENLSFGEVSVKFKQEGLVCTRYTDDTQQALAIAELLVSGRPCTPSTLAESFLVTYNRDKRPGYSHITRKMLESPDPASFLDSITEQEKAIRKTDGSAMRALPLGFLPSRKEVIASAKMSAAITHGHKDAIAATVAVALFSHERYYHSTPFHLIWDHIREEIREENQEIIPYCDTCADLSTLDREKILEEHAPYGVPYTESRIFLGSLLFLLGKFWNDPYQLLIEAILLGGDTDTLAAVALGTALIRGGDQNQIWSLIADLEDGPYGKEYLMQIGDQLSARYPSDIVLQDEYSE